MLKSVMQSLTFASLLALGAGVGHGATVSYQKPGDAFAGNGSAVVRVDSIGDPDQTVRASAGGFFLKGDIFGTGKVENFVGWCLDITHALASGTHYTPTNTPFAQDTLSNTQISNISRLFNTALAGLNFKDGAQSAGFQLALWEIIYEKPNTTFNLYLDNLTVTGNSAAIAAGQAFLNNLVSGKVTQRWDLVFLESVSSQDLVTATPVPVPATAGLMLLALGGLAAAGRRRRTH